MTKLSDNALEKLNEQSKFFDKISVEYEEIIFSKDKEIEKLKGLLETSKEEMVKVMNELNGDRTHFYSWLKLLKKSKEIESHLKEKP